MINLNKRYTVGSLFAGIGGIDLAFQNVGCEISWANEIDKKSCETYSHNFKHELICDDIKNLSSINNVDIITAGFPCQAFSIAGFRRGFEDDRGLIFFDLLNIIKQIKPRIIFLENVKNLLSHDKGKTFQTIQDLLKIEGYFIKYQVLNTYKYSFLPQNRERIYIICFRQEDDYNNFVFPSMVVSSNIKIAEFLEDNIAEEYYYKKQKFYSQLKEQMLNPDTCYQWRRHYLRENKNNLCPTLTANMGTGGHNVPLIVDKYDIRKLTPRECARLQGFPDTFILPSSVAKSILYKQIGNSVSVPVVQSIAQNIIAAMQNRA